MVTGLLESSKIFCRVVGKFKGAIKAYRLPLPRDLDDHTVMGHDLQTGGFFQVLCFFSGCFLYLHTHDIIQVIFTGLAKQRANEGAGAGLRCQG